MALSCLECEMRGFNMKVAYIVCFGVILFCLAIVPSQESFSMRDVRTTVNRFKKKFRREKKYYEKNINSAISQFRRRYL